MTNSRAAVRRTAKSSPKSCTKQIALQAACGVPIDLWTMVFGGEDEKESYYYYRRDRLSKIVTHGGSHDAHMRVFPSLRPVDEYKAHWGTIGVDVEQHAKLPFACVTCGSSTSISTMCLDVKQDAGGIDTQAVTLSYDDTQTEVYEKIHQQPRTVTSVNEMPYYSEFQPWDRYVWLERGANGKERRPCYMFYKEGYKYRLPEGFYERVHEWCRDKSNAIVLIKNSEEQGFECKLPTIKKAQGGDEPAFVRPLKETRRPKKAEDLPASASPMQIRVCRLLQPASQPAHTAQAAPQAPWRRGRA
mmetsp:Transcript_45882/g.110460  ORF Transcript_45882/g.110460 Transcript_45882/m.110460 type:complete len:302 (+) Transcript_45882:636-1541(+)